MGDQGYVRWTLNGAPIFEIPASSMTNPPQGGKVSNPRKIMIEEPSYFLFNVAMASAWGATPPNWEVGPCRGNATDPADPARRKVTDNICDSFPMYMWIDYIRVWQDLSPSSTMNIGCDPPTHPTKEFIDAYILNYTDPSNPALSVAGGASCKTDDDCTIEASPTGNCIKKRCTCLSSWGGPRCTNYGFTETSGTKMSYGPELMYPAGVLGVALIFIGIGTIANAKNRHDLLRLEMMKHGDKQPMEAVPEGISYEERESRVPASPEPANSRYITSKEMSANSNGTYQVI